MGNRIYDLIKTERGKRGLPNIYWSREMARLAQSQANYCTKVGHLVHSDRYAFRGGECLAGGYSPGQIVNSWLRSKKGHREYILSPRITKAGVGTAKNGRNGMTFAAFAFSDQSPSHPDCPYYKPKPLKIPRLKIPGLKLHLGGKGMLRIPVRIFLGAVGLLGIMLGAHGLWVYFNRLELLFGGEGSKLFLTIEVPIRLREPIEWASLKGLESWFLPAIILAGGIMLFSSSGLWEMVERTLIKFKLW